jgi:hypothetical protein
VCLKVTGTGVHVDSVSVQGNIWGEYLAWDGHYHVWGPGFSYNTPEQHISYTYVWSWNINRNLPNQSKVCAEAWRQSGGGHVSSGLACIVVHS